MRKDIYIKKDLLHIWDLAMKNGDIPELIKEMLLAYEKD